MESKLEKLQQKATALVLKLPEEKQSFFLNIIKIIKGQEGFAGMAILYSLIGVVVVIIVLASAIPILWPMAVDASGNITAMTGTDAGTDMIQGFWPVALLIVGLGLGIAVIVYALKQFNVMDG